MEWMWDDELLIPELDVEMVAAELVELCMKFGDDDVALATMLEAVAIAMDWRMAVQLN